MLKRVFDILFASAVLLASLPVLVVAGIAIMIDMGRPVLFVQQRPGKGGRAFYVYKLRTMRADTGVDEPSASRVTPLGELLRKSSIDELPQMLNVIRGEMSIVGPRPLLMSYLDIYTTRQMKRHDVAPGITGLAQVLGRNGLSWRQKFAADVWYVENRSFIVDLWILLLTVKVVITGSGVNRSSAETMPKLERVVR